MHRSRAVTTSLIVLLVFVTTPACFKRFITIIILHVSSTSKSGNLRYYSVHAMYSFNDLTFGTIITILPPRFPAHIFHHTINISLLPLFVSYS